MRIIEDEINTTEQSSQDTPDYCLISPRQFYDRINLKLDEPIGQGTVYKLVKQAGFPSVKIGGRFFVIEDKISEWLLSRTGKKS